MAYIEENLQIRSRPREDDDASAKGPPDPQEALYRLADRWKVDKLKPTPDDGSVTNSMTMLTAIPEVDLGMEYVVPVHLSRFLPPPFLTSFCVHSARLKNIEETEKAKRVVAEERHDRRKPNTDEEHLAASRCESDNLMSYYGVFMTSGTVYRPNLRAKSDTDILRDAKLEAMGLPPQDDPPRRPNQERVQMATDEMVCHFS